MLECVSTYSTGSADAGLAEYGLIIPVGIQCLDQQLPEFIEDASNDLTFTLRRLLNSLREDMQVLNERVTCLDKEIAALSSQQTAYRHLLTIPGVSPLIAAAFISEVDALQFSSGRELSAWCGLVPRQHSSGGKQRLSSVTKNGNRSLRTLIIHGARSVMRCVKNAMMGWGHGLTGLKPGKGS
ncbi:transposase [Yersinia enterocolitica]|uniref:transposase n=1 Tax=Yersinia enterocolitica TaxID=630 RepID=UPI003D00719B